VGPQTGSADSQSLNVASRLSSRLPGADVVGARDCSWGGLHFSLLYLDAKPSHVGANVDGLARCLHRPTDCHW
jgi:hypothetical protein